MVFETVRPIRVSKAGKERGRSPAPGVTRRAAGGRPRQAGASGQREAGGSDGDARTGVSPPPMQGDCEGLGAEGQSWPAGPGTGHPRGPVPSGVLLKAGYKRRGQGTQGALTREQGQAVHPLPQALRRLPSGCLALRSPPWGHKKRLVHAHSLTQKPVPPCASSYESVGREHESSGTALDSPEPDLQAAAPAQSWTMDRPACRPGDGLCVPQCGCGALGWELGRDLLWACRLPEGQESGPEI